MRLQFDPDKMSGIRKPYEDTSPNNPSSSRITERLRKTPVPIEASVITQAWIKNGTKGWDAVAAEVKKLLFCPDEVPSAVKQYYQRSKRTTMVNQCRPKVHTDGQRRTR